MTQVCNFDLEHIKKTDKDDIVEDRGNKRHSIKTFHSKFIKNFK